MKNYNPYKCEVVIYKGYKSTNVSRLLHSLLLLYLLGPPALRQLQLAAQHADAAGHLLRRD